MSESWRSQFGGGPSLLPHVYDQYSDRLLLTPMTERDYVAASFLDQRIGTERPGHRWVAWEELDFFDPTPFPEPQFIFHIGHVGSTLISRLLGELPDVLALREPAVLRTLADIGGAQGALHAVWSPELYTARLSQASGWYSRVFDRRQTAMIKASSFVSEIAADLLGGTRRSLFVYASLPRYIETILAGEASLRETHHLAPLRIQRLQHRLPGFDVPLWKLTPTQKIAMSWLCEMTALLDAARRADGRVMWLDFDRFLNKPSERLLQVAQFFERDLNRDESDALTRGPIMSTYSKAPEHSYSTDLRRQLLEQARSAHKPSIDEAVAWVDDIAAVHSLAGKAITLTDGA